MNRTFTKQQPLSSDGSDESPERLSSNQRSSTKKPVDLKVTSSYRKTALKDRGLESLSNPHDEWRVISGNSNLQLAEKVAENLGIKLTPIKCTRFNDGECNIQILPSVRNLHVYVVQSTSPSRDGSMSINDHVMELFLLVRCPPRPAEVCVRVTAAQCRREVPNSIYTSSHANTIQHTQRGARAHVRQASAHLRKAKRSSTRASTKRKGLSRSQDRSRANMRKPSRTHSHTRTRARAERSDAWPNPRAPGACGAPRRGP